MPFYHTKDNGQVGTLSGKCQVCGKRWPWTVILSTRVPKGMYWEPVSKLAITKGQTSYAGWADRLPGVSIVASRLPNWPRWVRVLTVLLFILLAIILVLWFIRGF